MDVTEEVVVDKLLLDGCSKNINIYKNLELFWTEFLLEIIYLTTQVLINYGLSTVVEVLRNHFDYDRT